MTKGLKIVAAAAIGVVVVLVASYLVSPYVSVMRLVNAARAGDKDGLEDHVDFPAVREHLKAEVSAALITKLRDDPEMRDNPFAGLGLAFIPMLADKAVDTMITPEGLIHMLDDAKGASDSKPVFGWPRDAGYITLDRFRVTVPASKDKAGRIQLILRRQGLFGWKLTRIELPKDFLAPTIDPAPESSVDGAEASISDPVPAEAPPTVAVLIRQWADENDRCRGGHGDDPATGQACDDREATGAKIDALGWCYGQDAQYGYQSKWARCHEG